MLVVVAVDDASAAAAEHALAAHHAAVRERRVVAPGRWLLYAAGPRAEEVVAALRAEGWRAAARPQGGGHLAAWRAHTAPVVIEGRLCVCFPWSEFDRVGTPPAIEIDPGPSFGTGGHASTRLLLTELARRVRPGSSVLDVGCGSGVLSLAAALLGARAVATDIDPAARVATRANAEWNRLPVTVEDTPPDGRFDAVVANISADVLQDLAPALVSRVAPGGWIGLSGTSPAQLSRVGAAYRRAADGRAADSPAHDSPAAESPAADRPAADRRAIEARVDGEWAALILPG